MQLLLRKGLYEFDDLFHNILECMVGYILFIELVYTKNNYKLICYMQ